MKNYRLPLLAFGVLALVCADPAFATNPLIMDQFTADPTARVFEGKIYVYPSHDIPATPGKGRVGWFCMEDYHVFSSENLTDWKDHGVIVSQTTVDWVNPTSYSMWAPDCVWKNGTYYFYFPAQAKEGGFRIGVATSKTPYGPFKPESAPIEGVRGIDPCVFLDKDGQAYIYYSQGRIFVARLKENMRELDSPPVVIDNLPTAGLLEGPFVFERNGIYYLTYPHVQNKIERLEYSTSNSPMGPFKPAGVILDESASGCWTVHHSILAYKGQWYLFYHDKDLSPDFDKNRSIRADYLSFNEDGTIKKVTPTLRGVGIVDAKSSVQIDRYSAVSSGEKASVSFLDEANKKAGWKLSLGGRDTWARFNQVDFGTSPLRSVNLRAVSATGGPVEIHLDKVDGPLLARVDIPKGSEWKVVSAKLVRAATGIHDLVVTRKSAGAVDLDWLRFE